MSAEEGSGVALGDRMAFSAATVDRGRLLTAGISREPGLCCHESVPERARLEALRAGAVDVALVVGVCAGLCVADVFDLVLLPLLLKPSNSGTSSAIVCDVGGSIVDDDDAGGVIGGGVCIVRDGVVEFVVLGGVAFALTGLIDFARSAGKIIIH